MGRYGSGSEWAAAGRRSSEGRQATVRHDNGSEWVAAGDATVGANWWRSKRVAARHHDGGDGWVAMGRVRVATTTVTAQCHGRDFRSSFANCPYAVLLPAGRASSPCSVSPACCGAPCRSHLVRLLLSACRQRLGRLLQRFIVAVAQLWQLIDVEGSGFAPHIEKTEVCAGYSKDRGKKHNYHVS
ncbi:hypothetical protein GUJ93_ZPchr0006g45364 [Zizania palustris]|uniref:Uncharacterized protein n=1 Tax=Zizania palustris TaxID=103762 RepID=A0A8J5T8Q9_ZIZPA|nr:hypothetical protein GUJ93_ZPchr0006g45364 [Zizania palustris]